MNNHVLSASLVSFHSENRGFDLQFCYFFIFDTELIDTIRKPKRNNWFPIYIVNRYPSLPHDQSFSEIMHQSFIATALQLWGRVGNSWAKVRGNYFSSVPAVQGKWYGFDIRILTPGRFSIAKGGAKNKVLTSSLPPGGRAYSRALKLNSHNPRPSP